MSNPFCLRWSKIGGPHDYQHVVRATWGRNVLPSLHSHDFAEVFWVESGACLHQINGQAEMMEAGGVRFIRPGDVHRLTPRRGSGFTFVNVATPARVRVELLRRFPYEAGRCWREGGLFNLPLYRLEEMAGGLPRLLQNRGRFEAERFFLQLIGLCQPPAASEAPADLPGWLRQALMAAGEPEIFRLGVAGLAHSAGRSPEHLARETRRRLGQSPGEIIREARLRFAARELRLTSRSVLEIAADCGYANPAPFYLAFKKAHGLSPLRYRKAGLT